MTHRHVQVEMVEQPSVYIPARRAHKDTCTWCSAVGYCMLHCWRWRQYALVQTDPRTGNSVQTLNWTKERNIMYSHPDYGQRVYR